MADVRRSLGDLARHRREQLPGAFMARVEHLGDLVGGQLDAVPGDVFRQALEAALALAEAVDRGDDLPPQVVLRLVAPVRRPGRRQRQRQGWWGGWVSDGVRQ